MVKPYIADPDFTLYVGDAATVLRGLPDASVNCCLTSPPYWLLRDYEMDEQIGLEDSRDEYLASLVNVFHEVHRVLVPEGTLWVNIGDTYVAKRPQRVPWRLEMALEQDGWWPRADIIWNKLNPMPSSVKDRPTICHEYLLLLAKRPSYYYDGDAIAEPAEWARWGDQTVVKEQQGQASWIKSKPTAELIKQRTVREGIDTRGGGQGSGEIVSGLTRNARSVWSIPTQPYPDAHYAVFPEELVRRVVLAGCPEGGVVLDPFLGSGTTALVARRLGRRALGIELNPAYAEQAAKRTRQLSLLA